MDEKELRRELTQIEGDHAKAMEQLKRLEQQVAEARTNVVRIEGAHGYVSGLLERSRKQKESLQDKKPEPDASDTIVAEVVEPGK